MKDSSYTRNRRLIVIKTIHTLVWIFFNVVIFYLLYAVLVNKIDEWLWIGLGLFALEGLVLLAFGMACPLTFIARKFSDSSEPNFDIFLPAWLAKHNKQIYSTILLIICLILIYQLIRPYLHLTVVN